MSTVENKAVFLSYASQDAEAARRICEGLRAAGGEVWFDQSELRGGDAWDGKIRKQIKDCALFVPIVSANTQARREGYFRLEWHLAEQRSLLIAKGTPFIVPVCIDDTKDSAAIVPDSFMTVQWTRLPGGQAPPAFCERVRKLLEGEGAVASSAVEAALDGARDLTQANGRRRATPLQKRPRPWLLPAVLAVAAVVALAIWRPWKAASPPDSSGAAPALSRSKRSAPPTSENVAAPKADAKSVAVLPFENLSAEPDSAYFADGLHEEVLTAVGKVSALRVIGRASVRQYADTKKRNLREIGAALGVASVVEGSVRRAGNRVRIAVQLVDAQSSRELWSDSYYRELTDIFEIQSAIAKDVATTLKATLTDGERAVLGQQLTQSAEAYRLYLQGLSALRIIGAAAGASRARLESAIAIFEQAVAADPAFVQPYLQLASLHGRMFWVGDLDPTPERARLTEASADKVRQLAPASPEARLAAGYVFYFCRNDWGAALVEFRAVQAGRPNEGQAIPWEGNALRRLGRWPEALAAYARAATLEPQDLTGAESLLETQVAMRRYADAVRTADDYIRRSTSSARVVAFRAVAQFAIDGDLVAYRRNLQPIRTELQGGVRGVVWRADLSARDFASAEAFLASGGATASGPGAVVSNPVSHYRAQFAYLQGDETRMRAEAADARRYFESGAWTNRQQPMAAAELALADALVGDGAAARTQMLRSRELLRQRPDAYVEGAVRYLRATTLVVLGDREAALAELRIAVTEASPMEFIPPIAGLDPIWSSLKDDPRFEEILKSAKPL